MNYWIVSDLHLGHDVVFQFEPSRKGFETTINQLKVVNKEDVLINLGDIGFYNHEYWIKKYIETVNGKKILALGNHDKHSYNWFYNQGFDFICERFSLSMYGYRILFSHKPLPVSDGAVNIFGHLHRFNHTIEEFNEQYPFLGLEYKIYEGLVVFKNHILITTENDCQPQNLKNILDKHRHMWYNTDKKIKDISEKENNNEPKN